MFKTKDTGHRQPVTFLYWIIDFVPRPRELLGSDGRRMIWGRGALYSRDTVRGLQLIQHHYSIQETSIRDWSLNFLSKPILIPDDDDTYLDTNLWRVPPPPGGPEWLFTVRGSQAWLWCFLPLLYLGAELTFSLVCKRGGKVSVLLYDRLQG